MMSSSQNKKRSAHTGSGEENKRKSAKQNGERTSASRSADLQALEKQILESQKHYNNIAILIQNAKAEETESFEALSALHRVFCHLLASGALTRAKVSDDNRSVVVKWLWNRLDDIWALSFATLPQLATAEQKQCLRYVMQLLSEELLSSDAPSATILKERLSPVFKALTASQYNQELWDVFLTSSSLNYRDVAFALAHGIHQTIEPVSNSNVVDTAIKLLQSLGHARSRHSKSVSKRRDPKEDQGVVTDKVLSKAVAESWLAVLGQNLSKEQRKTLLRLIPTKIAPALQRPEKLLDFLVDSFDAGGSTALLALSGLFDLMQGKNLDYPQFYRKVYSMLDSAILHSKHRSNFLRLLDTFLASSHLPAVLVASFLKRLSRLCLFAPPAAIAYIVPLLYNLLKAHPPCTFMIHRQPTAEWSPADGALGDPFDTNEPDPMETGALESSLWEIHTLQSHYHPNVAIIARIISEQFTKPAYNLEDFLDHSYASMLEADLTKPIKKEPVIEYQIPKIIFPRPRREEPTEQDDVLELWGFGN